MSEPSQQQYRFTASQDWFSHNIPSWTNLKVHVESPTPRILEIGSWEGRSGVWLLQNLCSEGGSLVCIDHFDLMNTPEGRDRYARMNHNLALAGGTFRILDSFSFPALMTLLGEEMQLENLAAGFDWIYVDGSHEADDTLLDAELAWRLAKKNALFIFDDYNWETEPVESMHHPRRGIDAFLALHAGQYERLSNPSDYQVVLQKTSDMRIGFLNKEGTQHGLRSALGYSINIALTIDAAYAHAAAVAMRSVVEKTPGRITFYILSIGLDATVRDRLKASVPERADVTTNFVNLPSTGFTAQSGVTWGKIEMIEHLPIERVLYLDADILAVSDVTGIWKTDLLGKSIAAAVDVGFPLGHGEHSGTKYFNAGVLLMDLAKIRTQMSGLVGAVDQALSSRFKDQDALNRQFANDWLELSLEWNAQGLGTYADNYSAERISLSLDSMRASPKIVHFTGPVTPTLSSVLNPYVQPVTAKPWGYMGAPGHPFAATWWDTLECTAWKGWRATDEFRDECRRACKTAEAEGVAAFHAAVSASST